MDGAEGSMSAFSDALSLASRRTSSEHVVGRQCGRDVLTRNTQIKIAQVQRLLGAACGITSILPSVGMR